MRESDRVLTVGVADGDTSYAASLRPLSRRYAAPFRFYETGRQVLRAGLAEQHAIWLISLDLPDVSGFDLFTMLREEEGGVSVCLVGRAYRAEDEIRAYGLGAAMYACRPVECVWLEQSLRQWRARGSRRTTRHVLQEVGAPRLGHRGDIVGVCR